MKKCNIAVIALLALFSLSALACLFSFALSSYQDLSRQSRLARQEAFRAQKGEFQKVNAEYADWKKLPRELRAFRKNLIISMDDFAVFRRELNSCLENNGFRGASISLQFGGSLNRMRKVSIGFTLNGGYRELKKFIFDMERMPRMHFFDHITLSGNGEAVTGSFGMEAYLGE